MQPLKDEHWLHNGLYVGELEGWRQREGQWTNCYWLWITRTALSITRDRQPSTFSDRHLQLLPSLGRPRNIIIATNSRTFQQQTPTQLYSFSFTLRWLNMSLILTIICLNIYLETTILHTFNHAFCIQWFDMVDIF